MRVANLLLIALVGSLVPSPAWAQAGSGVACAIGSVPQGELSVLADENYNERISVQAVAQRLQPYLHKCREIGEIRTQGQVDASFIFAMSVLDVLAAGSELEAAGIDPATVEALFDTFPPETRDQILANARDSSVPIPEEQMKAYVAANSQTDEAGLLGTALIFLLAIARSRTSEEEFIAAGG